MNGLDSVDGTTEDTIEALIFDSDVAAVTGVWTYNARATWIDDKQLTFGSTSTGDVIFEWDENGEDQFLIKHRGVGGALQADLETDDPMMQILFDSLTNNGANMTADQDVFGIAKGTQSINVDLFVVDEDGDVTVAGGATVASNLDIGSSSIVVDATANSITMASIADDVCDTEGEFWYDTTTNKFEFCEAASGAPNTLGGGSATWTDGGTTWVMDTTGDDLAIGAGIIGTAKLSVSGDANQIQLAVKGVGGQSVDLINVVNSADAEMLALSSAGVLDITALGDAGGSTFSISTAGAAVFASVTTGSSSTPTMTFDDTEDTGASDASIVVNCATTNDCDMSFKVDAGSDTSSEALLIDGVASNDWDIQIGKPGTNYVNITEAGILSFAGTANMATVNIDGSGGVILDTDGDGALSMTGNSAGNDEDLVFNLDDTADTVTLSSTTGVTEVNFTAMNIVTSGTISGAILPISQTAGALTVNAVTLATAAGDYDLPDNCDSATGAWVMVIVRDVGETVSVTTQAEDAIVYKGIGTMTNGDELDSPGAIQDSVVFVCMVANQWWTTSNSGDWADGGVAD